jgi:hypothetical protein
MWFIIYHNGWNSNNQPPNKKTLWMWLASACGTTNTLAMEFNSWM